jgi:serine/threonine-protein kinase HipA
VWPGQFGLAKVKAASIIDSIAARVRSWRVFFEEAVNVPQHQCDIVASAFRRPRDVGIDIVAKLLQN